MATLTPAELVEGLANAPTAVHNREVRSELVLHEDDGGKTKAVLSVYHDGNYKQFRGSIRLVKERPRVGYSAVDWLPQEKTHNASLGRFPVKRYSEKALIQTHADILNELREDPNGWLGHLNLEPIGERD